MTPRERLSTARLYLVCPARSLARYRVPLASPLLAALAARWPRLASRALLLPSGEISVIAERVGR